MKTEQSGIRTVGFYAFYSFMHTKATNTSGPSYENILSAL